MKKKLFLSLLCGILVLGLATGCGNNQNTNKENQSITNENISDNYTTIDSLFFRESKI